MWVLTFTTQEDNFILAFLFLNYSNKILGDVVRRVTILFVINLRDSEFATNILG